uniref:(California timema) hypothetical protein n=1 Tax=Timema californicum TaxID=61474 RepID=A0A7R9PDD1_TIMCA|nr:unnamed protein product [Timema californicum]
MEGKGGIEENEFQGVSAWKVALFQRTVELKESIFLFNHMCPTIKTDNLAEDNQDRDSKDRQANAETRKPTTLFTRVADFLDLRLLKDTTLLVLVLGLSLAVAAETTFSYSTPLILFDMNFGPDQTAYIMSFITAGDILTRFLCPFIADWLRLEARSMYVLGLCVVLMSRFCMGKGIRSVYMNLVVPAYVSIEKVASALALQNLGVGVINLLISPLLGFLKDIHGSYSVSVIVLNMATLLVIVVLLVESVLNRRKKNVRSKPGSSHSQ